MRRSTTVIRQARLAKGLTQVQLARIVGVDQATISDLECGRSANPSWRTVKRLADALGAAPEELFPLKGRAA